MKPRFRHFELKDLILWSLILFLTHLIFVQFVAQHQTMESIMAGQGSAIDFTMIALVVFIRTMLFLILPALWAGWGINKILSKAFR